MTTSFVGNCDHNQNWGKKAADRECQCDAATTHKHQLSLADRDGPEAEWYPAEAMS